MVPNRPSQTAEAVCLMRALDQRHAPSQRILDDAYARNFLSPLGRAVLASWEATGTLGDYAEKVGPGGIVNVLVRHRFIDDCLRRALRRDLAQVVLLGAGYDSRAYRFAGALAGRPVFEVDFPATARRKARIVARSGKDWPAVDVRRVEIDFQKDALADKLLEAGFRRRRKTFVVWEGVSMYLTRAAVKATLATISGICGPGSHLAMDFWYLLDSPDRMASAYRLSANLLSFLGEPVTFGIHPEDAPHLLRTLGFKVVDLADGEELRRRYVSDGRAVMPGTYLVHARTLAHKHSRTTPRSAPARG